MPFAHAFRRLTLVLAAAWAVAACAGAAPTAPDPRTTASGVRGVVVDLSNVDTSIGGPGSEVYLLHSPEDRRTDAVRHAPITGRSPRFRFTVDSVPPGRYYLEACVDLGRGRACAPYTQRSGGPWALVDVRPGAVTDVTVLF